MSTEGIAARFASDTDEHEMTVLHDDGLYRHLRFRGPKHGMYWFGLITVPGTLIFQGDGDSFVFSRIEDMFEFFRAPIGRINPDYWAEKLTSGRKKVMAYDEDLFIATVKDQLIESIRYGDAPPGVSKALIEHAADYDLGYEENAHAMLEDFEYKGFRFHNTWEWDFRDYDWWFLWACHAIVAGIAQYDAQYDKKDLQAAS